MARLNRDPATRPWRGLSRGRVGVLCPQRAAEARIASDGVDSW